MSDSTAAIDVQNLDADYGRDSVLRDLSLSVPAGRVVGLLGLNGAGKTTLLRHLLGLQVPRRGTVRVLGGDPIGDRETVLSRVGYLSEEDSLPAWMSVGELLRFAAAIQPRWDAEEAERLRDWFDLDPTAPLRSLSKGTRARAGLIVAIAHRPELLILDEPSSGLDPIARDEVLRAIIETLQSDGCTVLLSSHQLDEVTRLCDDVTVLHDGQIASRMPIAEVGERFAIWSLPNNAATAAIADHRPAWLRRVRPGSTETEWLVDLPRWRGDGSAEVTTLERRPATLADHFGAIVTSDAAETQPAAVGL